MKENTDFNNTYKIVNSFDFISKIKFHFKPLSLKKNDYLVQQNHVCNYFCFVVSGILQHAVSIDGEEKTTYISLKNTFTSSLYSFLNQSNSRKHIKALVNTELLIISLAEFNQLKNEDNEFKEFYYHLIEKQICFIDDYRIDLLALSPEERYRKLLLSEPTLLLEVPLHYLASFLGISNRHMSRIRKNIK